MTFVDRLSAQPRMLTDKESRHEVLDFPREVGPGDSLGDGYRNLRMHIDEGARIAWCRMRPEGRPSYTHGLIADLYRMQDDLSRWFNARTAAEGRPVQWFVMASDVPGIFNLGGDLAHFADRIEARDLASLQHYGRLAAKGVFLNSTGFGLPLVTVALVQGDALGGGFEHALACDVLVAERSARLGLPEILFNLFPGMGAYSFLSRRVGRAAAEAMILSGRIYTGEELHAAGVVDVLAEDGHGEETVREYVARHGRKYNAHHALHRARKCVNPVTLAELLEVVDIWAETAMGLTAADLRKMLRLAHAQDRRLTGAAMPEPRREASGS